MNFSFTHYSELSNWLTPISTSYALIIAAEIGDKSQLVCMSLAAKHRAMPVLLGAITAFMLLNTLAVIFGAAIANWVPQYLVALFVCVLFALFGIQALLFNDDEQDDELLTQKSSHSLFFSTFLLITVAELGDKTQLAVIALSSTALPFAIWIGATLALATTSLLGVILGRTLLQVIPLKRIHQLSGILFITLASLSGYHSLTLLHYI